MLTFQIIVRLRKGELSAIVSQYKKVIMSLELSEIINTQLPKYNLKILNITNKKNLAHRRTRNLGVNHKGNDLHLLYILYHNTHNLNNYLNLRSRN